MVTVKIPVVVLPSASVAMFVTVVTPSGKVEPDGGVLTTVGTEQLSVAVTTKLTTALLCPGGTTSEMFAGRLRTGFWVSTMVTRNEFVVRLPAISVAMQTTVVVPFGKTEPEGGVHTTVAPGTLSFTVTV